jgi:hypothetical protein
MISYTLGRGPDKIYRDYAPVVIQAQLNLADIQLMTELAAWTYLEEQPADSLRYLLMHGLGVDVEHLGLKMDLINAILDHTHPTT